MNMKFTLKLSTALLLLCYSSFATSAFVQYSFEGIVNVHPLYGGAIVNISANFTVNSEVNSDCIIGSECKRYGDNVSPIWDITINSNTEVSVIPNTSHLFVTSSSEYDDFNAGTNLNPIKLTGSDFSIVEINFAAEDYDGVIFDGAALPTSIDDFNGAE